MKALVVTLASCAFLACASGGGAAATVPPPEIELVQLSGPADQNYARGDIEVQYGLRIANRAEVPITLRRVEVQTVGLGGSYRLRPAPYFFNQEIQPQQAGDVKFWAKAVSVGDAAAIDANAPLTIRVTAIFDSPSGGFRRVFSKMLAQ